MRALLLIIFLVANTSFANDSNFYCEADYKRLTTDKRVEIRKAVKISGLVASGVALAATGWGLGAIWGGYGVYASIGSVLGTSIGLGLGSTLLDPLDPKNDNYINAFNLIKQALLSPEELSEKRDESYEKFIVYQQEFIKHYHGIVVSIDELKKSIPKTAKNSAIYIDHAYFWYFDKRKDISFDRFHTELVEMLKTDAFCSKVRVTKDGSEKRRPLRYGQLMRKVRKSL